MKRLLASLLVCQALMGCAVSQQPERSLGARGPLQTVLEGTLEGSRPVQVAGVSTGTGALAGAALGGLVGSRMGKGNGKVAFTVLGVLLGAEAGAAIEENRSSGLAEELVVRLDNGSLIAVVQPYATDSFRAGQRVRVFTDGRHSKVTPR